MALVQLRGAYYKEMDVRFLFVEQNRKRKLYYSLLAFTEESSPLISLFSIKTQQNSLFSVRVFWIG